MGLFRAVMQTTIRRSVGTTLLNLNIRTMQQDWFSFSGQVQVDEATVVELRFLLEQARQSKSRFIPLGRGQFLALTQEFRRRLDELLYYGTLDSGKNGMWWLRGRRRRSRRRARATSPVFSGST